jgi:hypothetical protein
MDIRYVKSTSIFQIDHTKPKHFLPLDQIYVGISTSETIHKLKTDTSVLPQSIELYFRTCLHFYIELVGQIKQRFDFSDPLFDIVNIVEPTIAQDEGFAVRTLSPVLTRFPILKNHVNPQKVDSEWKEHNLLDHKSLGLDPCKPAHEYWEKVFQLKSSAGIELFANLKTVLRFLLILPFSNAKVERLFSEVRLTKTAHRNKLKTDTLVAILATKEGLKNEGGCVQFEPNIQMLKKDIWK